jgi:exonuclease SbcC
MLRKIYIDQMFRHFDRTIEFGKGLTGIIGKNESGKSLIVEAIRFALFGSAALRGKAEDYKKLHVELWFDIKGIPYHVIRKAGKVELYRDGAELASGTKPVNAAIIDALGYDLTVFDVANACNQGNVEALSNMRPTERKSMVDRTIGLDVLDDVIAHCGAEALAAKKLADALSKNLVEPIEPIQPESYTPAISLESELQLNRGLLTERNQLHGWLTAAPAQPVAPAECLVQDTVAFLTDHQRGRQAKQREIADLERDLKGLVLPKYPKQYLDAQAEQWIAYGYWLQKKRFLDQGDLCCPSCNHTWPIAADALKSFEGVVEVEKPEITEMQINTERDRLGNVNKLDELTGVLNTLNAQLVNMPDRSADLAERLNYETQVEQYDRAVRAYESYQSQAAAKRARFNQLDYVEELVGVLEARLRDAVAYERDRKSYEEAVVRFNTARDQVTEHVQKSDEYAEAKRRVQALKVQVKTHLLPSLNKVASILLNQMTGGERYEVLVDEDFEITIDGQPIGTLSGSGKAVANLAVRIALGQILTNKVFSVFFADEVDAAMDDDRAAYTAQALRRLTDLIGQVVIITHKRPETDHLIELKK